VRAPGSADGGDQRLEAIAPAAAILRRLRSGLAAKDATVLSPDSDVPAIFEAASHGDELASRLLDEEARHIPGLLVHKSKGVSPIPRARLNWSPAASYGP
jgi:predicted NBD/HSP70 family sugar kinase